MARRWNAAASPGAFPLILRPKKRAVLLVPALFLILLVLPAAAQEGEIIQEIEIQGLNKISREKVLRALPIQVGKPYRPRLPGEILQAIWKTGYFIDIPIPPYCEKVEGGIKLIMVVRENPAIKEIEFAGNTKIPTDSLKGACPVKPGDLLAPDSALIIRSAIERLYRAKGYSNATVSVNKTDYGTTQTRVQVFVDEGQKLQIKDLHFRGNKHIPAFRLRFPLENKGSWLFFKNYYNSRAFQDDLDMVRLRYLSKGYFDVQIHAREWISDPKGKWISPIIEIEEGPRYRVGEIHATGAELFLPERVIEPFDALRGHYYNAEQFAAGIQKVKDMYGDLGYINAEVYWDRRLEPQRGIAHFDLRIAEHERVYVRQVLIQRNEYPAEGLNFLERIHARLSPPVDDEVIRREVSLKTGEAYQRFQEVATADRLRSLGIFDSVKVEPRMTNREDQRDAVITVEEGNTGNLIFGVGLSELEGVYVHGAYVNRNLFGQARHLRTSFLLGTHDRELRISYLDRYFNLPGTWLDRYFRGDRSGLIPFRLDLYHEALRFREYDETHTGISAVLTRILREGYLTEDWGARLEYVQTEQDGYYDTWRQFGNGHHRHHETEEDFGDYPVAALSYYAEENTTDDWWWPTRGHILGGGVEAGYADGPLLKLTGRYSLYNKLNDYLIHALNVKLGWMPLNAQNVGISERLFLGGGNDLRAFSFRGAGPVDDKDHNLHIGGSTKLLVQDELRFPIYGPFKGFLFFDAGMLGEKPFELGKPRASTGLGIRFSTAKGRHYGPRWRSGISEFEMLHGFYIEVSLGVLALKDKHDDLDWIHFNFGSAF